ncbi:MAG: tRNA (adenosine(37)-N6)-threonylcarbamoyltransferase complex ATPase subunit type 1 TsaE [Pseudobdellovibrionaceae bacterium]
MSSLSENPNYQLLEVFNVRSLEDFHKSSLEAARHFTPRAVVALSGPLGAGKTEFVKTIAKSRGFHDVASPTFAIHHRYQGFSISLDHLDLYRLENEDELETTGFWDFFSENEGLIFIEWPERMNLEHIPLDWDLFVLEIQVSLTSERVLRLFRRK